MSAIAAFIKLPKTALDGLLAAATPKKRIFGQPRDNYFDYLQQNGEEVADYRWSGYVLGTLLPYLADRHQIDLMESEHNALSEALSKERGATHFILTNAHRIRCLDKLDGLSLTEEEGRDYYNEFNQTHEPDVGKPMLEGVKAFRQALGRLDESSVLVFIIS
jgi:hypothetical protein